MTLGEFQNIDRKKKTTTDNIEQLAFIICDVFGFSEEKVNNFSPYKFLRYSKKIERALSCSRKWWDNPKFILDAKKITLGQFIECQHFLKSDTVEVLHLVAASILKDRKEHSSDALRMQGKHFKAIIEDVEVFIISLNELILSYGGLFEIEDQEEGEEEIQQTTHPFVERYGWIYSTKEVANFQSININEAYNMNIVESLNIMSYLKSKGQYEKEQAKKK